MSDRYLETIDFIYTRNSFDFRQSRALTAFYHALRPEALSRIACVELNLRASPWPGNSFTQRFGREIPEDDNVADLTKACACLRKMPGLKRLKVSFTGPWTHERGYPEYFAVRLLMTLRDITHVEDFEVALYHAPSTRGWAPWRDSHQDANIGRHCRRQKIQDIKFTAGRLRMCAGYYGDEDKPVRRCRGCEYCPPEPNTYTVMDQFQKMEWEMGPREWEMGL